MVSEELSKRLSLGNKNGKQNTGRFWPAVAIASLVLGGYSTYNSVAHKLGLEHNCFIEFRGNGQLVDKGPFAPGDTVTIY